MGDLHVGDYGQILTLECTDGEGGSPSSLDSADSIDLFFTKPTGGDPIEKTGVGSGDEITYTIEDGLISEAGRWAGRAEVEWTGVKHATGLFSLDVDP